MIGWLIELMLVSLRVGSQQRSRHSGLNRRRQPAKRRRGRCNTWRHAAATDWRGTGGHSLPQSVAGHWSSQCTPDISVTGLAIQPHLNTGLCSTTSWHKAQPYLLTPSLNISVKCCCCSYINVANAACIFADFKSTVTGVNMQTAE